MTERAAIGIYGLGVMGRNLAGNFAGRGFAVAVHDPWPEARGQIASRAGLRVAGSVAEFVAALERPRRILLMVKAGEPVDDAIAALLPVLEPGDIVMDGGNSHYRETMRRGAVLAERGIDFLGIGISGGEEGALHGPSIMVGGQRTAFEKTAPLLAAIAARHAGEPCCAWLGGGGAGHFVKMMHNGIEYAEMQLLSEVYLLLKDGVACDYPEMRDAFAAWNAGPGASYLLEITAEILGRRDPETGRPMPEIIVDRAEQKGTGRWAAEAALELGMAAPTLADAVAARALSMLKAERVAAAAMLAGPSSPPPAPPYDPSPPWGRGQGEGVCAPPGAPTKTETGPLTPTLSPARSRGGEGDLGERGLVALLGDALYAAKIAVYAQGFAVLAEAARAHRWELDLARVAEIWRAGCIIRSALLDPIAAALRASPPPANLLLAFAAPLAARQHAWREAVMLGLRNGIPVPALASSLAYYDAYRTARLGANLIQCQRDYFGAHGYERIDRAGTFHTEWRRR